MKSKGQTWTVDFLIGTVMFFIALFVFYQYYSNTASIDLGEVSPLRRDAQGVANYLMSQGYPKNWDHENFDEADIAQIGIVDEGFRLNESKLAKLYSMDYQDTRKLLNTKYDYYFQFIDKDGNVAGIAGESGYGKEEITKVEDIEALEPKKIVTLSRFVFYERGIYRMVLYVWD